MSQEAAAKPSTEEAPTSAQEQPRQPIETLGEGGVQGGPSPSGNASGEGNQDDDLSRCPICQFIEAGECKKPHQDWVACRSEAKAAGKDYVEECQDHFKAFLQCAIDHRDYYEPFLEMLGGLPEEEGDGDGERQGEQQDEPNHGRPADTEAAPVRGPAPPAS